MNAEVHASCAIQTIHGRFLIACGRTGAPTQRLLPQHLLTPCLLHPFAPQLERVATAGVVVVVALVFLVVSKAIATGFPAIVSGDFPLWFPKQEGGARRLPEGLAVLVGGSCWMLGL